MNIIEVVQSGKDYKLPNWPQFRKPDGLFILTDTEIVSNQFIVRDPPKEYFIVEVDDGKGGKFLKAETSDPGKASVRVSEKR